MKPVGVPGLHFDLGRLSDRASVVAAGAAV